MRIVTQSCFVPQITQIAEGGQAKDTDINVQAQCTQNNGYSISTSELNMSIYFEVPQQNIPPLCNKTLQDWLKLREETDNCDRVRLATVTAKLSVVHKE